nr:bifunctional diaminohydroxyphosphoribosylaminopyrimidine deaminase/5-amino-6-(5-phosphoribosylamino)uracil reductase RibD [Aestuariimicrobium kwangyangense]
MPTAPDPQASEPVGSSESVTTPDEHRAMLRAIELAALGPEHDPNPRVGCVILAPDGTVLAEGFHRGAGTPHAEAAALADLRARGHSARGATAVVTLEPCRHTGRTGACSVALLAAGIVRVVYAVDDPGAASGGGGEALRGAGIDVVPGLEADRASALIADWLGTIRSEPEPSGVLRVILKTAATLDGRIAATDGSSQWITGRQARAHAHAVRAHTDALVVGTGTVLADNPSLTARPWGVESPHQPLRVVVGHRPIPVGAAVDRGDGRLVRVRSHDPQQVLDELLSRGVRHVVVEGGPTLATAFLRAGIVNEIHAYLAPLLLGSGRSVVDDLGTTTLGDAHRWHTRSIERLGDDVLVVATAD